MRLNEILSEKYRLHESDEKLPEGVLSRATYLICHTGKRNANNRVYEKAVWEKVLEDEDLQYKLENRALFGQAEHPAETQSDLQLTSHVIHKMWISEDGKSVYQTMDFLDTPMGRIVDCLVRAGCGVGVSTRAEGDIEEAEDDEGSYHRIVPESYNYVTTDATADPSTFGTVPIDVKRNAISEIKKELENKELKEDERKFTQLILESMECKDGKCVIESAKKLAQEKASEKKVEEGKKIEEKIEDVIAAEARGSSQLKSVAEELGISEDEVITGLVDRYEIDLEAGGDMGDLESWISDNLTADLVEKKDSESKTQTIEDLVKNEFIKIGAIVEFKAGEHKDKKGKVEKIEEGSVSVSVGEDSDSVVNVNVYGNTYTSVSPDGVITVLPVPSMETDVMEQPPEEAEPELPPEEEEEVIDPPVEEEESEEEDVEEKCKDKKKVKEQEVEVPDKDARSDTGIPSNVIPVEKGLSDKILPGNVLRDKEKKYWVVNDLDVNGLSVETAGGGVGAEINIPWDKVEGRGLIKVQEVKSEESKVDETKDIKAMYKSAGLPAPDGKGVHTKAFHKLAIDVAKGYVEGGDSPKKALKKAYPTAMKQLGKEKAVKKASRKSESKEVKESKWTDDLEEQREYITNWLEDAEWNQIGRLRMELGQPPTPEVVDQWREEILAADENIADVYKHIWKGVYGPSESISTTAKEMTDLRIQEASTRAERDKAFEVVVELEALEEQLGKGNSNKLLEVKILIKKLKETMSRDGQVINALRRKVEEKAVLAKQVEKQLSEMKANLEKDMAELIAESKESNHLVTQGSEKAMSQLKSSYDKEVKDLNESKASTEKKHLKEVEELKTESDKKLSEEVEKARKEVTEEFVKQFVMFRLAETGLTVDENSRALLEECRSLDQVDDTLDELRDIGRRSALHSQPLKEVVITEPVDPDQADVDRKVGAVFEGFGYTKGINDD